MANSKTVVGPLGVTIRRARKAAGLSLEAVAQQASVSKGYLSKVESGQATPSSGAIVRLANVFGLPVSDILMPDQQRRPLSLVRANERTPIKKNGTGIGYSYELAAKGKLNPRAEVFFVNLPTIEGKEPPRFKHPGEEIIHVLEGRVRFIYGGIDLILNTNDCLQFDSGIEHYVVAEGGKPARLFVVSIPDWLERK